MKKFMLLALCAMFVVGCGEQEDAKKAAKSADKAAEQMANDVLALHAKGVKFQNVGTSACCELPSMNETESAEVYALLSSVAKRGNLIEKVVARDDVSAGDLTIYNALMSWRAQAKDYLRLMNAEKAQAKASAAAASSETQKAI